MSWIKEVQEAIPWLVALPLLPKLIISAIIVAAAALLLVLLWTPPPETAVTTILKDCYRRALFTRMHAQISEEAMFASIGECRNTVQKQIPNIRDVRLRSTAVELLATLSEIERKRGPATTPESINKLKLRALQYFRELAKATGADYPLPDKGKLGETAFFTQAEADAPPSSSDFQYQHVVDPDTGETRWN
jgi:hypothetical protein